MPPVPACHLTIWAPRLHIQQLSQGAGIQNQMVLFAGQALYHWTVRPALLHLAIFYSSGYQSLQKEMVAYFKAICGLNGIHRWDIQHAVSTKCRLCLQQEESSGATEQKGDLEFWLRYGSIVWELSVIWDCGDRSILSKLRAAITWLTSSCDCYFRSWVCTHTCDYPRPQTTDSEKVVATAGTRISSCNRVFFFFKEMQIFMTCSNPAGWSPVICILTSYCSPVLVWF